MQCNKPRASEAFSSSGALLGYLLGIPWLAGLFWAAFTMGGSISLNILLLLASGLTGWILGVLVTPLPHEASRFSEYGKTITAFVSGFLLSKLERLFGLVITQKSDVTDILISRLLLGAASLMLGVLFTFVWRSYVARSRPAAKDSK
jgi:hypothetical protein